ncbi:hypothetical protein N657DRAFT_638524 [Parathielavia appendiculata]|uniref:Uncharacterized protein n=1 Tax=Parathielavia appendiculata TaxID=2587402 RepID=A0AAN6U7Y5_9PEZI|nr:hypothetical protein N657DRAFT_638524 [Parathielavia appendiculata]
MPRRKPKTPVQPADTAAVASTANITSATKPTTRATANASRKTYQPSAPAPKQVTFPARRKVIRTYGGRRSLPARLETTSTPGSEERMRKSLRQQTLTQVGYVRSSSGLSAGRDGEEEGEGEEDMLLGEDEMEGLGGGETDVSWGREVEVEAKVQKNMSGKRLVVEEGVEIVKVSEKRRGERRSKRRKTMGDVPTPTAPGLERKGSSFHTQTLTQFLGASASRSGVDKAGNAGLRVADEDEVEDLPLPGNPSTPNKRPSSVKAGQATDKAAAVPFTPSNKHIKAEIDEVPSSQPTPFTPMLGYSPIMPIRSPLTQKSTNVHALAPAVETTSKRPRTLVIQDSYSMASSEGLSSSVADESPRKEEGTPPQPSAREPLSEIPLASLELGVGSTPTVETSSARRKEMFFEIPDSDDEMESVGSTPFKARSTQQTPLKRDSGSWGFPIAWYPAPGARSTRIRVSETPASLGRSDKENESPGIQVWNEEETINEGEEPGSRTPRVTGSQTTKGRGSASQASPNTASQFWTASVEDAGGSEQPGRPACSVLAELAAPEPAVGEAPGTPTPGPRPSQFRGSMRELSEKPRKGTPQMDDSEETASEAEEEHIPTSILRKPALQRTPRNDSLGLKKRQSTPIVITSDSSASEAPGTPTPAVRKVQIELPPAPGAEEVCKETPRREPHKPSPVYQRQTQARSQARSQFYSYGLESQRVPMEVIRSLGSQTDRSDIVILIDSDIVDDIVKGLRDHEFRDYRFPMQVCRCWIFAGHPANEVKYMATLGPAQEPGQIDSSSGLGNAEFNAGASGHKFAHKLLQVYQLNNPVPLEDMADNGLGEGPPAKYRYIPPAIVGQLLANLRCSLFEEEGEVEGDGDAGEGDVTISQELEEQFRSDIIHSTQLRSTESGRHHEEEDIIPASQSPLKARSNPAKPDDAFARPPIPAQRSSQRLRNQHQSRNQPSRQPPAKRQRQSNPSVTTATGSKAPNSIRPSQATTASDISVPSSPAKPSSELSSDPAFSVPRPPLPGSSEPSLPEDDPLPPLSGGMGESSLLPLPPAGFLLSSSQTGGVLLPPDSLLVDEGRVAPPPVVWGSDDDEDGEEGEEED